MFTMFVACTHFHINRSPAPQQGEPLSVCWPVTAQFWPAAHQGGKIFQHFGQMVES